MAAPNYEQLKNGPSTTLNGAITATATSLVVTSATGFPTVGNFRILIATELLLVTAVSGTTFTVTRGVEGTAAAAQATGLVVTHVLTAGAMSAYRADALLYDAFGNRPGAGVAGRIFIPTDGDILQYDDGTVFQQFGPLQQLHQPPAAASFSHDNTLFGSVTDASGTIYLVGNLQAGWNIVDQYIAKPATPYTIIANFQLDAFKVTNTATISSCGIHIRDSVSAKIVTNAAIWNGSDTVQGIQFAVSEFTNFVTISADEVSPHSTTMNPNNIWIKFTDDGTNRIVSLSNDGQHWTQIDSRLNSTFVPATYNQVGFFINTNGNAGWFGTPAVSLRSWKQS